MQLFASELYRSGCIPDAALEDIDAEIPALVSSMLCEAVEKRLSKELSVGFSRASRPISRVRGRIDVLQTYRNQHMEKGRVHCEFNELTADHDTNQYLLRALEHGVRNNHAAGNRELTARCRRLVRTFRNAGVRYIPTATTPAGRLSPQDLQPIATARLLLELKVPSHGEGYAPFWRARLEEHELRRLFERALLGIYEHVLTPMGWTVAGGREVKWPLASGTRDETQNTHDRVLKVDGHLKLPKMFTDITLTSPNGHMIIVDAKFTSMATKPTERYGSTLKSEHLYQISAYVNAETARRGALVSGAIVYATVGDTGNSDFSPHQLFSLGNNNYEFVALDLMDSPMSICTQATSIQGLVNPITDEK
ncbi:5-methylcytosine restriction system specificity protein McrC [Corynebacterium sp. H78]|uniref:5-methylcytosine restriction system specificity protein McrC n=1 Tax=Corynebacterium sp. H78 TaxID=3133417 RepID=UPI0030A89728